ncbi:hypothetical protein LCGC14_0466130 [marine sediment metagenome]|uniref:Uncharacterized protein n=1 Tax=marine sediment metagenome TaxID=412755 RepID=A0A0F9VMD2_9ZZZZ
MRKPLDIRRNITRQSTYRNRLDLIENKIANVIDTVCEDCPQNIEDTCRAFNVPHSDEERVQRSQLTVSGKTQNCMDQTVLDKCYTKYRLRDEERKNE